MLQIMTDIITFYLPLIVAAIAQIVFLVLPVNLRNWNDDLLNAITFTFMQVFVAGLLFLALPIAFDSYRVELREACFILGLVFLLAWARTISLIPLEFTYAQKPEPGPTIRVHFEEFAAIRESSLKDGTSTRRFGKGMSRDKEREMLVRRRPEKADALVR